VDSLVGTLGTSRPIGPDRVAAGKAGIAVYVHITAVLRRLLVLGGGSAGVELAQVVRRFGGEAMLIEAPTGCFPANLRRSARRCAGMGSGRSRRCARKRCRRVDHCCP
jgi:hypothetical protein